MDLVAIGITVAIIIVVIVITAYVWFYCFGWSAQLVFKNGDIASISIPAGKTIAQMRFKNCKFSIFDPKTNITHSANVSHALNYYTKSFNVPKSVAMPTSFSLPTGLNPFSFTINGYTDIVSAPDPTAKQWCPSGVKTCQGDADCAGVAVYSGSSLTLGPCKKPGYSSYSSCPNSDPICASKAGPGPSAAQQTAKNYNYPICVANTGSGQPGCVYAYQVQGTCSLCYTDLQISLTLQYKFL